MSAGAFICSFILPLINTYMSKRALTHIIQLYSSILKLWLQELMRRKPTKTQQPRKGQSNVELESFLCHVEVAHKQCRRRVCSIRTASYHESAGLQQAA